MKLSDDAIYGSSLFAATAKLPPPRAALTADLDVDICIVGGGLAGLTAARELALRGRSVVLLEGRRIAWNASGRNTGFVLPGFAQTPDKIVARVGLDQARLLWALSQAGLDYIRETISQHRIPADPSEGWLYVSKTNRKDAMRAEARLLEKLGASVDLLPKTQTRALLKTPSYFQAIEFRDAFNIQPLTYALALARLAEQAGAQIHENTQVLSVDPDGVRKYVVTAHGRLRAGHVVMAGNVHLGAAMPSLARTLMPVHTYVVASRPLGAGVADAIAYRGSVSDTDRADNHYRLVGDRLVLSGRMTVWQANPRRFIAALRGDIARLYPQLGDVGIDYVWSGVLGHTVHRMPQIGQISPGFWIASGFGGHGLNTTAMAGNIIARAIAEGDDMWRLFSPFDLVWAGGVAGRAVAQVSYWGSAVAERFATGRIKWPPLARAKKSAASGSRAAS